MKRKHYDIYLNGYLFKTKNAWNTATREVDDAILSQAIEGERWELVDKKLVKMPYSWNEFIGGVWAYQETNTGTDKMALVVIQKRREFSHG